MDTSGKTVEFIQMKDGTYEDYQLLQQYEDEFIAGTADRVLSHLLTLENSMGGYKVSRLEHALQCATRAWRDGAGEEMTVAALLHDIGDHLAPENHGELAAAVLRPYVSERTYWILKHHGVFQGYYFFHHLGGTVTPASSIAHPNIIRPVLISARSGTSVLLILNTTHCRLSFSIPWSAEYLIVSLLDRIQTERPQIQNSLIFLPFFIYNTSKHDNIL